MPFTKATVLFSRYSLLLRDYLQTNRSFLEDDKCGRIPSKGKNMFQSSTWFVQAIQLVFFLNHPHVQKVV